MISQCTIDHRGATLDSCKRVDVVVGPGIIAALAAWLVSHVVVIEPVTLALCAVDSEHMLEQVCHNSIWLLHMYLLVTL